MRAKQLTNTLATAIKNKRSILIKGSPGIGKTDIITDAAHRAGAELVVFHPVVSDPTDFKGMPAIVRDTKAGDHAEFLPFGELRKLVHAKTPTIAFFDDLGQASPSVQAAVMQLVWARQINGHKISDHVSFMAATNRKEDKAAVNGIIAPLRSRFHSIIQLDVSVDDWIEWAYASKRIDPQVIAFIRYRPGLLTDPGPVSNDIVNNMSPRTLTNMNDIFCDGLTDIESLGGAVGEGPAVEFIAFVKIWSQLPDFDKILANPRGEPIPKELGAKYAVAVGLATKSTVKNFKSVVAYMERVGKEFEMLTVRDAVRITPAIEKGGNPDFTDWVRKNQGWVS